MRVSSNKITPSVVKEVMYVEVFPFNSSVLKATITESSEVGTNLNEENPLVDAAVRI